MSAMGMCPHNNQRNYCVSCARESSLGRKKAMNGYYDDRAWAPQMGTTGMGLNLKDIVRSSRLHRRDPISTGRRPGARGIGAYGMSLDELYADSMRSRYLPEGVDTQAMAGMGISLEDVWRSMVKGAEKGAQSIGPSVLSSVVQTASKDPSVQQQLQMSATEQVAANVMKNKWMWVGGIAAIVILAMVLGRGTK